MNEDSKSLGLELGLVARPSHWQVRRLDSILLFWVLFCFSLVFVRARAMETPKMPELKKNNKDERTDSQQENHNASEFASSSYII